MNYLYITLVLSVTYNMGYALYPSSNNEQQQQLLQPDLLQKEIQNLQQQLHVIQQQQQQGQGRVNKPTNIKNILLPKFIINDFDYIPTVQGYRLRYRLPDATIHEENAFITGLRMDDYSRLDSKNTDFTAVSVGGRPKMKLKNRKLSPGSLKAFAG